MFRPTPWQAKKCLSTEAETVKGKAEHNSAIQTFTKLLCITCSHVRNRRHFCIQGKGKGLGSMRLLIVIIKEEEKETTINGSNHSGRHAVGIVEKTPASRHHRGHIPRACEASKKGENGTWESGK